MALEICGVIVFTAITLNNIEIIAVITILLNHWSAERRTLENIIHKSIKDIKQSKKIIRLDTQTDESLIL